MTMRLKRDKATADKLYEELLQTEDPRIRVGFYSVLSSAGVKSVELRVGENINISILMNMDMILC